jgi:oligopeptide/dipeptide ABC transporter ATP-binding protein
MQKYIKMHLVFFLKLSLNSKTILKINDLNIDYLIPRGTIRAVDNVNFKMEMGDSLGIIGESGCGKTTLTLSLMKLLPPNGKISSGDIFFKKENLSKKTEKEMENIRWNEIAMVFQGALNFLNPIRNAGEQIVEGILTHNTMSKSDAWVKAEELLELVQIPKERSKSYPHELSGGMKQRVMIAMALACNPELVIFDEPMTALDIIVQAQIMNLIKDLNEKLNLSSILVTHNWNNVSEMCNRCLVMYAGKIVENNTTSALYQDPLHPYTQALLESIPSVKGTKEFSFRSIPGSPPNLANVPKGCRFNPRCNYATDICREMDPEFKEVSNDHFVACHKVN